ncbi:MAG: Carbamoyl-phosphate synthase large chain [Brockia lithotrophica]|uniref:Carbamoyl-phosphate synthase large chain n=1 Tax=Brockia lithotrophica TaxID=933949 RepID=A0A2T5G5H0_9BACL|nr:MAG: Carbamoyl-phosphate synthase large chain [Brockia lithotrophica]
MPRDTSIRKVLVIGSGPIVIGQAAEFDYSGTQACLALRDEGIEVVLLNNNPATLMTDPALSHRLYMEPLTPSVVEAILERERPDGILANLGGQVGLNLALALHKRGSLRRLGVRILGTDIEGIARGEDREAFRELMHAIGEPVPRSATVQSVAEGLAFAREVGFPLILRPAFTLGGEGSGIAHDVRELEERLETALALSPIHQVLVEESIVGWKEIEFEGLRDVADEVLIVTAMENVDPMGIHTGDSVVVAPAFTVPPEDLARMAQAATRIYRAVGLVGGANIQFAYHPERREYRVIEINPRVSRSSALASKATGYPIAWATTKLSLGYTLRELPHPMLRGVSLADPPVLRGQVVLKVPRFAFDKFPDADRSLGTTMKATGEVLAIDESFEAALAKGVRSLEIGAFSLTNSRFAELSDAAVREELVRPTDRRLFVLAEAIRRGMAVEELARLTAIDPLFLRAVERIVREEEAWSREGRARLTRENLARAKALGLSDAYLAKSVGMAEAELRRLRAEWGILPDVRPLDTRPVRGEEAVGEIARPYFYFTYASFARELGIDVTRPPGAHPGAAAGSSSDPLLADRGVEAAGRKDASSRPPVGLVLGSGPIRIGQGIEFDYASVHALWGLQALGYAPVVVNNNPETVSTDASVVDRLYIAPLTVEDVWEVVRRERPEVILAQFGGQTSLNLALPLLREGAPVADVNLEVLTTTEGREEFYRFLDTLGIPHAEGRRVFRLDELEAAALELGFPLLVRPSFVIGGEAMRVLRNARDVVAYVRDLRERGAEALLEATGEGLLLDRFLDGIEFEIDLVTDGWEVLVPGVFRHIEGSGVHSGDSHAFFPAPDLPEEVGRRAREIAVRIVRALGYRGAMNIQFVYDGHDVYVLEVNPRVSRTLPIAGKVRGTSYLKAAVHAIVRGAHPEGEDCSPPAGFAGGGSLARSRGRVGGDSPETSERGKDSPDPLARPVSLKVPVFSHRKIRGAFVHLGPEMTSTGEALVFGRTAYEALAKAYPIGKTLLKGGIFLDLPHRGLETRPGNASGPYGLSSPLVSDVRRWREMYRELSEKGIPLWLLDAADADVPVEAANPPRTGGERGRAAEAVGFRRLAWETALELIRGEVAFLYAPWPDDMRFLTVHHEIVRLATLYGVPVFLHPDLLYASLVAALNPAVDPDFVAPLEDYALGVRPDAGEPSEARRV